MTFELLKMLHFNTLTNIDEYRKDVPFEQHNQQRILNVQFSDFIGKKIGRLGSCSIKRE